MATFVDTPAVAAAVLADTALDKPLIIANNIIELYNSAGTWIEGLTGAWSGTDRTLSGYPTRLGHDRKGKLYTVAASATNPTTVLSLVYRLSLSSGGVDGSDAFDCACIFGHNYASVSNLTNVDIDIGDTEDFTTANVVLQAASWTPDTGPSTWRSDRLVDLSIVTSNGTGRQLSNCNFVRVRHTFSSNMYNGTYPRVGELWLGKRQQLTHWPMTPHPDRLTWVGESASLVSDSGNRDTHTLWGGASHRDVSIRLSDSTEEDRVAMAGRLTSSWQKPFVWIELPASRPRDARIMRLDGSSLAITRNGPVEKTMTLSMLELPPFRHGEYGNAT